MRQTPLPALRRHFRQTFTSYEGALLRLRPPSRYLAGFSPLQTPGAGDAEYATRVERIEQALEALDSSAFL